MIPELIYHITSHEQWSRAHAEGAYRGDTLATEGFIHASIARQVMAVAQRFYHGRSGLVILSIDRALLRSELRFEAADNGDHFPHIYGPLNLDSVVATLDFPVSPDGTFQLPLTL